MSILIQQCALFKTLFMAFGNMLNLGGYFFLKYVIHRRDPNALDGQAPQVTPLIMLPVKQVLLFKNL